MDETCTCGRCPWKEFQEFLFENGDFHNHFEASDVIKRWKEMERENIILKGENAKLENEKNETRRILDNRILSITDQFTEQEQELEKQVQTLQDELEKHKTNGVIKTSQEEIEAERSKNNNEIMNLKQELEMEKQKNANTDQQQNETIALRCHFEEEKLKNDNLQREYSHMKVNHDTMLTRWQEVVNQRDELQKEVNAKPTDSDVVSLCDSITQEDFQITLTAKDENGRFGVKFGLKAAPTLLNESNITVLQVNENVVKDSRINVNDFILRINGENVQGGSMASVINACRKYKEKMDLVIRRGWVQQPEEYMIEGRRETWPEWGFEVGVFIKKVDPGSYAQQKKLCVFDEIVGKINDKKYVTEYSITHLYKKFNDQIKFNILRNGRQDPYDISIGTPSEGRGSIKVQSIPGSEIGYVQVSPPPSIRSRIPSVQSNGGPSVVPPITPSEPYQPNNQPGVLKNQTIELGLKKKSFEAFGWKFVGGNKIGILVNEVENWKCAERANIKVGWRLLEIGGYDIQNIAYSFALDVINSLRDVEEVNVKFEKVPEYDYSQRLRKKPFDSFHVEAISDCNSKSNKGHLSFKKGDRLEIIDSYVLPSMISKGDELRYMWRAKKVSTHEEGLIPSQRSQGLYNDDNTKKKKKDHYRLLDEVDVKWKFNNYLQPLIL